MLRRETRKCPIQFVFAKTLFDGGLEPRFNILIEIENGRIKSLCGLNEKDVPLNALNAPIVAPGFIDTDMTSGLPDQQKEALLTQIPLARLGQPEEIAAVVGFLAGESGSYITGETIHVNGGMYMA